MTRRTFVICPVRDRPELTKAFLANMLECRSDWSRVLVLDNGSQEPTRALLASHDRRKIERVDTAGLTIYEQWNVGFERCRVLSRRARFNVLVTNNDVELPPSAVAELSRALAADPERVCAYPDYDWPMGHGAKVRGYRETTGVLGDGGMLGACFMLAGERCGWAADEGLVTDTGYGWWFGDNHLARTIEQAGGKQVRVVGLPLHHVNEGTARHHPELDAQKRRDRARWIASGRTANETRRRERRHVPGTIVWSPGGRRRSED